MGAPWLKPHSSARTSRTAGSWKTFLRAKLFEQRPQNRAWSCLGGDDFYRGDCAWAAGAGAREKDTGAGEDGDFGAGLSRAGGSRHAGRSAARSARDAFAPREATHLRRAERGSVFQL